MCEKECKKVHTFGSGGHLGFFLVHGGHLGFFSCSSLADCSDVDYIEGVRL